MTIPQTFGTQFRPLCVQPGTQERHNEQTIRSLSARPGTQERHDEQTIRSLSARPGVQERHDEQTIRSLSARPGVQERHDEQAIRPLCARPGTQETRDEQTIRPLCAPPGTQESERHDEQTIRPLCVRPGTQKRHNEQRTCGHLDLQQMDWKIGWRINHLCLVEYGHIRQQDTMIRLALQIKMLNWAMPLCFLCFPIIQRAKKKQPVQSYEMYGSFKQSLLKRNISIIFLMPLNIPTKTQESPQTLQHRVDRGKAHPLTFDS